jgi:predicted Zn-dependent protease
VQVGPIHRSALVLALAAGLTLHAPVVDARSIGLIRDAEIEGTLERFTAPILDAAGLGADSVQIYIVNDPQLNAFVAGGMNLFLNTGLIMRTEGPGQLVGVVAHEVGHIAGGHLSRVAAPQRKAAAEMILATVLGAATAVIGAPGLGTAIIAGGQSYAVAGLMRFSRSQEQAADQAALTYLDSSGLSARGLAEFFRVLENQNVLAVSRGNPYLQSHPLTRDRITFVENHVAGRSDAPLPTGWAVAHARMVAKLRAFLSDPREVLQTYQDDQSVVGRYARAIAHYRLPDLQQALADIDGLLTEHPEDPYFHELKGQMLFENGRVADAVGPYREAVRLTPGAPLIRVGLAQALVETGAPADNSEAIAQLEEVTRIEPDNAGAWRLLGVARGRDGLHGKSDVAFAEYALRIGKRDDARLYARRAEGKIPPDDPAWLQLQDILREIEES